MSAGKKPTDEEIDLFRRSVGPVRTLSNDRVAPLRRPQSPRPRRAPADPAHASHDQFSDMYDAGQVTAEDSLFFSRPGLQQRLLKRFRRGQLAVGDELDLHGMTTAEARIALLTFISSSREHGSRCVRIIHGKGYGSGQAAPVLKNRLNSWLRQHHDVLAFSSATPRDGGAGALYVLLRTKRD